MTIECYLSCCPEHSCWEQTDSQGPFCFHQNCQQSERYVRYAVRVMELVKGVPIPAPYIPVVLKRKSHILKDIANLYGIELIDMPMAPGDLDGIPILNEDGTRVWQTRTEGHGTG